MTISSRPGSPNHLSSVLPRLAGLPLVEVPVRAATPASLLGYGRLVRDFAEAAVDIVPWPVTGRRRLDPGTGVGGGVVSGQFDFRWRGDTLFGDNDAVDGHYVTGWARRPEEASTERATVARTRILVCEANYHPDGGQVFFPRGGVPYLAVLARPGDDVAPSDFVAFVCPGDLGLHVDAGVWHQPVYPLADVGVFDDKQSAVHGCVSVDLAGEHGCLLVVPIPAAGA